VPVLDARKTQKAVPINREINPAGDQAAYPTANGSKKCQGMGVGGVAVKNVIMKCLDQISNTEAGNWIGLTVHENGKHRQARFSCFLGHRGIGLTHQMTENPPFLENLQKVQGLLFAAAPCFLGIEVKDLHVPLLGPYEHFSDNMLLETEVSVFRFQVSGVRERRCWIPKPETYLNYRRACCPSGPLFPSAVSEKA